MQTFNVKAFLRPATAAVEISTIPFSQLVKETGATGFMPQATRFGTKVFLMKGDKRLQIDGQDFAAINIGSKANTIDLDPANPTPFLKELVNNNVIYHGVSEGVDEKTGEKYARNWMAFSRKGTLVPGKTVNLAELMAELKIKNFAELG